MSKGVMGLDLSLLGGAAVVLPTSWSPGSWKDVVFERFTDEGKLEGIQRVMAIVEGVQRHVQRQGLEHVFVEQYAFSFRATSVTGLAELGGAVKYRLWQRWRVEVVPVVASHARKVMFGKMPRMGRKEWKAALKTALGKMNAPFPDEDTRDAFLIANCGRFDLGLPAFATSV